MIVVQLLLRHKSPNKLENTLLKYLQIFKINPAMCLFLYNKASVLGKYGNNYFFLLKAACILRHFLKILIPVLKLPNFINDSL